MAMPVNTRTVETGTAEAVKSMDPTAAETGTMPAPANLNDGAAVRYSRCLHANRYRMRRNRYSRIRKHPASDETSGHETLEHFG
jgi:hypothetical protein